MNRWVRRTVTSALVVMVMSAATPLAVPTPVAAASTAGGGALSAAASRGAFLATEVDDSAAEEAAEEMGAETSAEDTGAGGSTDGLPPAPAGANPLPPDPGESVLPDPVEREGSVERITIEEPEAPPGDPEDADLDPSDEVVAKRTERSKTYANGDGSFTTESSMAPMHVEYRGGWEDIDVALHEAPGGEIENGMASVDIALAEEGSSDELATVGLDDGTSVAYGLEGAEDVEPELDGAVATYEDILPGVDLELESIPGGLKETAVLASAEAPSELTFTLALDGLTAAVEETGGVALSDDDGVVVAAIPPGSMVDSGTDGGASSDAVAYALEERAGQQVLVVTPDRSWLEDPARVWPVRVDPTTVDRTPFDDTYVKNGVVADRSGALELRAGPEGGANTAAYMSFWMNIPVNSFISAATLYAHNTFSAGGCTAKPVGVYRVTQGWSGSTMTGWPGATYNSTPIDVRSFAHGGGPSCPSDWAAWDVRSLVTNWTTGSWPNYGVSLRVPTQNVGDAGTGKRFTSIEGSSLDAFIRTTWSPWGAQYNPGLDWAGGDQATNNSSGSWPMQIRNAGSTTWVAGSDVKLGTRVYTPSQHGTGTPVAQSRTTLPEDVSPQELVAFNATVPALPPGTYEVFFEMVKEGDFWFSAEDPWNPRQGVGIQIVNQVPRFVSNTPDSGDTVSSRQPLLSVVGEDPDDFGFVIDYFFRICPGPVESLNFPSAVTGCQSSGWQSADSWTPPTPLKTWNEPAYWWAFIRDRTGPEPRFAQPVMIIPTPAQGEWATLGASTATASDGGVDVRTGNFTSRVTDLSIGWGSSTFDITRTYNSIAWANDSAMGRGWSSLLDVRLDGPTSTTRPASLTLYRDDGRRETWARDTVEAGVGEEVYKGPLGSTETLTWDTATSKYVWRQADRTEYRFNTSGTLETISRPGFRDIAVTRSSAPSTQAQTFQVDGATVTVEWSSGRVVSIRTTGPTSDARWRYTYLGPQLSTVCDPRPTPQRGCQNYGYHQFPVGLPGAPGGPLWTASSNGTPYLTLMFNPAARPRVLWREDGEGHRWNYAFSTFACPGSTTCKRTTVTQPNPSGTLYPESLTPLPLIFEFDRFDRLVKRTNERGYDAQWLYDALGFMYQSIDENGIGKVFWYDKDGHLLVITEKREDGSPPVYANTRYEYGTSLKRSDPRWGLPIWIYDPRVSHITDGIQRSIYDATWQRYDTKGRLVERWSPRTDDGRLTEHFTYVPTGPAEGQLQTSTDRVGRVTTFEYDANGRLDATVTPTGVRTEVAYDGEGRPTSSTRYDDGHPGGVTTTVEYDEVGQAVRVEGPPVTNVIDAVSRRQVVEWTYDPGRRVVEQTSVGTGSEADRTTAWTEFDGNGRPTELVDPEGRVTTVEWSWRGQVLNATTENGLRVTNQYARSGQVARVLQTDLQAGSSPTPDLVTAYAYDQAGRMATMVDARGAWFDYTYWDDGRPRRTTLANYLATPTATPEARVLSDVTYDLAGNPIIEVTRNMTLVTARLYDLSNALTKEDTAGRYVEYDHRADGLVETMTVGDATHADVTQYGYTALPEVQLDHTAQQRGGSELPYIVGYDHDDRGLLVGVTEPNGRRTDLDYDTLGQLVRTTAPAVTAEGYGVAATGTRPVTETGYNSFGEVIQGQSPDGTTRTSSYDRVGRPVSVSLPPYSPAVGVSLDATTTFAYDDAARTRTVTDELRATTTTERLDHRGRVVEVEDPPLSGTGPGAVTSYVRNTAGDVASVMGPSGQVEEYTHDNVGLVTRSRQVERYGTPGTFESLFVYDAEFDLVHTVAPSSSSVINEYNVFGELRSTRTTAAGSGVNIATSYGRDHRGRVVRVEDNLGRAQENVLDQMGLLTQSRTYDGSTLLRSDDLTYDANLDLATVSTPGPNPGSARVTTTYQHDALGRLTALTEPGNLTTSYGYDVNGRPVRSTDGNGNATWTTYTPWDDVESVVDPATTAHPAAGDRTWGTTYEAPGLASRRTAPGGVVTDYDHDAHGNPVSVSGTGGDGAASKTFAWDASDRLVEAGTPAGTTQLTWDDRGNIIETSGASGTSSLRYDPAGRMKSRTDAGATSTFTYWSNGLLKTAAGNQTGVTEQYSYDITGALQTMTYPSGTTRSFAYDGFGNVASDTLKTNSTTVATQSWTYGADGEHIASTTAGPAPLMGSGVESYTYDGAGRISTTTRPGSTVTTTWDGAGNRLADGATTATYDQRNRVLTSGPSGAVETYQWTPRGTLDSTTSASGTTDYRFDAFDRLIRELGPGVDDQYQWDGLERLASVDGAPMTYAGLERDPVAVPGQVYERGPGGGIRAFEPTGGTAAFVRSNHRGDASATFVPGATTATSSRTYSPFGVPTSAGTPQPSFGYQGDWTSASGLAHMDARFYDPATGTFISRDSWDLGPGPSAYTNRYTYGSANPVSMTDPTGHATGSSCHGGGSVPPSRPPNSMSPHPDPAELMSLNRGFDHCDRPPSGPGNTITPGGSTGPGNTITLGGSTGPTGSTRPTRPNTGPSRPKPPAKPVEPPWVNIRPSTPAPVDHLVPLASASLPIVEESLTLHRDPTDVPVATYMPETSSRPTVVPLAAGDGPGGGGGGSWGGEESGNGGGSWDSDDPIAQCNDVRDEDGDLHRICAPPTEYGIVMPNDDAVECILSRFSGLFSCPIPDPGPRQTGEEDRIVGIHENEDGELIYEFEGDELGDIVREAQENACSFSAETRVLMADGTTRPISEIVVGDWVVAIDPETGARGAQQVTRLWVHEDQLLDLRIGDDVITTTEDHPFWNETDQEWQPAAELGVGDLLLGADGATAIVGGLVPGTTRTATAYNLAVDAIHTYVVVVDGVEILVHNECVTGEELARLRRQFDNRVKRAYWRDQAANHAEDWSAEDLAKIRDGNAPIGDDGYPLELHHKVALSRGGSNDFDNIEILSRTAHRLDGNYRLNHPN